MSEGRRLEAADDSDDDDDPVFSSAASCITLRLMGSSFRPSFTHQCFDGERIRGYEPTPQVIQEVERKSGLARKKAGIEKELPHKSFRHHNTATHHLGVTVSLAPSCRTCSVSVETNVKLERKKDAVSEPMLRHRKRTISQVDCTRNRTGRASPTSSCDSDSSSSHGRLSDDSFDLSSSSSSDGNEKAASPSRPGNTRRRRMHTEEILERTGRALPPVVSVQQCKHSLADSPLKTTTTRKARPQVEDDYLSKPFGTVLHEYKRVVRGTDESELNEEATFVLCLADGKDNLVAEYHRNVQKLALFFIETADNVDLTSNEGGGYWKALYVFRKHATEADDDVDARVKTRRQTVEEAAFDQRITRSSPLSNIAPEVIIESRGKRKLSFSKSAKENFKYSLVGYMTLFHFHSPFKKPKPGMVLRICQAVILPPYQRAGHGKTMFQAVYDIASGTYESELRSLKQNKKSNGMEDDIVEINVEDPAPAFVCLRDRIDFELLKNSMRTKTPLLPSCYSGTDVMHQSFFTPLSETDTMKIGAKGRITPRQVQIAFELLQLDALEQEMDQRDKGDTASCVSSLPKTRKTLEKRYRLMVKKRLLKTHREELGGYSDNKEKQAKLNELYEETFERYINLLGRNKKE